MPKDQREITNEDRVLAIGISYLKLGKILIYTYIEEIRKGPGVINR